MESLLVMCVIFAGLVGLLLALVLGLLVWTSYGVYSQQQSETHSLAAPQGQAGHADRAAVAQCRDHAMGAGGGGHILGPGAGHERSRVHRHIPHPGEVDDEPTVAQGAPRPVVPAAAHRQNRPWRRAARTAACTSSGCLQNATIAGRRRTAPFQTRRPFS